MSSAPQLEVAKLNVYQGSAPVVFELSFNLLPASALVLQGANGAGKSSVIKAIMGLLRRNAVAVKLEGLEISQLVPDAIARLGVGYVPENRRIFTRLSVLENLQLAARPVKAGVWHLDSVLDALPHLKTLLARDGGSISGGEQRMLAVARALMLNPSLLLLDEPCEGVAPKVADAIEAALRLAMGQGASLLLSESHEGFAHRLGAGVLKLHAGAQVVG